MSKSLKNLLKLRQTAPVWGRQKQTFCRTRLLKLLNIGSLSFLLTLSSPFIPYSLFYVPSLQVLGQSNDAREVEADRLLQQGIEQFQTSQFEAALQSWQQALDIYREIKDRQGEGNALGNLGVAYRVLGDYPKAIEFHERSLKISQEMKDRLGEGQSLGNLGIAYYSLGDYAKAIEYQEQVRRESCA